MSLTLEKLISKAHDEMIKSGYCEKSIYCAYSYIWVKLYEYNDPQKSLEEKNINKFLIDYFGEDIFKENNRLTLNQKRYLRAFSTLIKVNNNEKINSFRRPNYTMNYKLKCLYDLFINKSIEDGNSSQTIINKQKVLSLFIQRSDFNNPSKDNINQYLINIKSKKTITNNIDNRIILKFLKLCYENEYISLDLLNIWPNEFPNRNYSNIPSEYSVAEIKKLLEHANNFKDEDCHLRNFAILCLIVYTGLRITDVSNLTFDNINWKQNTISLIQSKTKKEIVLPLIPQIGNPLVNYITNERPKSTNNYVFVTEKSKKIIPQIITSVINRYFYTSGIDIMGKHYGAHSLRHSLATNLLNNNIPAYNVSKCLGHSDTRSLKIYAKVNLTNLKKCVLECPYE